MCAGVVVYISYEAIVGPSELHKELKIRCHHVSFPCVTNVSNTSNTFKQKMRPHSNTI